MRRKIICARDQECLEMNNILPENCKTNESDSDDEYDNNNDKSDDCNETNTIDDKQEEFDNNYISISAANNSKPNSSQRPNNQRTKYSLATPMENQSMMENRNQRMNHKQGPSLASAGSTSEEHEYLTSSQPSAASSSFQLNPMNAFNEERMRRKLQFFFMNPIEKWQARRKFPFKFAVQLIKIVVLTIQLCLFAHSRYVHVNYAWDNRVSFAHLFLRTWDDASEVDAYPAAKGPMALYFQDDFYATIDYAMTGYMNLSSAIGSYSYPTEDNSMPPLNLCISLYSR